MPIAYHQPEEDNNIIMDCLKSCIDAMFYCFREVIRNPYELD